MQRRGIEVAEARCWIGRGKYFVANVTNYILSHKIERFIVFSVLVFIPLGYNQTIKCCLFFVLLFTNKGYFFAQFTRVSARHLVSNKYFLVRDSNFIVVFLFFPFTRNDPGLN